MDNSLTARFGESTRAHFDNIASNLQLVADFAYADVALAVADADDVLTIVADARPVTAIAPFPASRVGAVLSRADETEAYAALERGGVAEPDRVRTSRGITYVSTGIPVRARNPERTVGVILHSIARQVTETPGAMESAFMEAADDLTRAIAAHPLLDVAAGTPFSTRRDAGDGVLRVARTGLVEYASPNAVNIMRLAGVDHAIPGTQVSELPGGGFGVSPVLGAIGGVHVEAEVAGRVLDYRSIGLSECAIVLVADLTEPRRRELELKVKDTTIREIHHRVKNNLQTVASLLRIQARRADSDEVRHALLEATQRVAAMAVVHELLAGSAEERLDFAQAAGTVVDLVRQGMVGEDSAITVRVAGSTGLVEAQVATSLALIVAELVHNALEHGFVGADTGSVEVSMRRVPGELVLSVRDDGCGVPQGFDPAGSANLGLAIVRAVVEDDLRGTLAFSGGRGTTVTVRVPIADEN